jgi:hypothetical protein
MQMSTPFLARTPLAGPFGITTPFPSWQCWATPFFIVTSIYFFGLVLCCRVAIYVSHIFHDPRALGQCIEIWSIVQAHS